MNVLASPADQRAQIQRRIQERDAQLESRLAALETSIEDVTEIGQSLRADADSYQNTEKLLQWAFPVALAVGLGGGYLLNSPRLMLGGLVAAAGSHFVRIVHSGQGSSIYGRLVDVSKQKTELAQQVHQITQERADLKSELAQQLEMLETLTGQVARGLNVQINEETVTVGDFELTRYS